LREVTFLKKNAEKWKEIEAFLSSTTGVNPDKLADLFIQLTDDLSYSRTFILQAKQRNISIRSLPKYIYRFIKVRKNGKKDFSVSGNMKHPFSFINTG
jgi:hypothetical protein